MKNYYKILCVKNSANKQEIKRAYRKLAKKITQIKVVQMKNLKKYQRHMKFYQMIIKDINMIIIVF